MCITIINPVNILLNGNIIFHLNFRDAEFGVLALYELETVNIAGKNRVRMSVS
jgi:hypothetical protein